MVRKPLRSMLWAGCALLAIAALAVLCTLFYSELSRYPGQVLLNSGASLRKTADALGREGRHKEALKLYQAALIDLTRSIDRGSDDAEAYHDRGLVYLRLGNLQAALVDFSAAIELDPEHIGALNNRGNTYSARGHFSQAIQDYSRAIALDPHLAEAWSNLGIVYARTGQDDRAIEAFTRAIDEDPSQGEAYFNRSAMERRKGDNSAALRDALKARQLGVAVDQQFLSEVQPF